VKHESTKPHMRQSVKICGNIQSHARSREDWARILPLLKENEESFGLRVEDLLNVDEVSRRPEHVYRKVVPIEVAALAEYERGMCIQSKAKNEIPPDYP